MELKDKVTAVKGVGPKMEEKLGRPNICLKKCQTK